MCFRENTEGEYANVGGRVYGIRHDVAIQTSVFTRAAASGLPGIRKSLTVHETRGLITKSNVLAWFWDECAPWPLISGISTESPADRSGHGFVRRRIVRRRRRQQLFGDILTDLAAIVGGASLAASGTST